MTRSMIALFAVTAALVGAATAQERVYRWTDAQGVVHYSQTAPDKVKAEELDVRTPTPPTTVSAPDSAPTAAAAASPCDVARRNRDTLLSGRALGADRNGDGKPDPMTEEELQAAKDLNAKQLASLCKSPETTSATPPAP